MWKASYGGVQIGYILHTGNHYRAWSLGMGSNTFMPMTTLEEAQSACERACMLAVAAIVEATVRVPHEQQTLF